MQNILFNTIKCEAAYDWQLGFQYPATPAFEGIVNLHNDIFLYIVFITIFVSYMLASCWIRFVNSDGASNKVFYNFRHQTLLETVWTIAPALILLAIAIPSFALLYSMDEVIDPSMTVKCVGHQWYWSYEYSDYNLKNGKSDELNFDSYMIIEEDLEVGQLRLLEVDNRLVLPIQTHIRVIITAADVLHCWTIPSFGIKLDACPGRLNQTSLFIKRPGVFYGQCSEICGINHGFMPIVVEAVSRNDFAHWLCVKMNDDD